MTNMIQHQLPDELARVRQGVLDDVHAYQGGLEMTPRTRGFICGFINANLEEIGSDPNLTDHWRSWIFNFLFSKDVGKTVTSSKQLEESHLYALYEWAKPYKHQEDGNWASGNGDFQKELSLVYNWVKSKLDEIAEAIGWTE